MNELLIAQVINLAKELYGESRHQLILRNHADLITAGRTINLAALDEDQLQSLLSHMQRLNRKITKPS